MYLEPFRKVIVCTSTGGRQIETIQMKKVEAIAAMSISMDILKAARRDSGVQMISSIICCGWLPTMQRTQKPASASSVPLTSSRKLLQKY